MADRPIIRIEYTDDERRARDKINENFRQLGVGIQPTGQTMQVIHDVGGLSPLDREVLLKEAFDASYPVGSIIFTNSQSDPRLAKALWKQHKDVFLYAAGDIIANNQTGGSRTHTLTLAELPVATRPHTHEVATTTVQSGSGAAVVKAGAPTNASLNDTTAPLGEGNPHNNMPPYLARYCYERIG